MKMIIADPNSLFNTISLVYSDVDDLQSTGGGETCTLNQLRALTTNSAYTSLLHPIGQAVQVLSSASHIYIYHTDIAYQKSG